MLANRQGECGKHPLRSDRFFAIGSEWYFSTREGASIGPFTAKKDAETGLNDFIEFLNVAEPSAKSLLLASLENPA